MPIKVACACGAAFAAKDELAGRTVKCPKCAQPLTIPASGAAAPKAAPAGAAKPAAAAATTQRPSAPRQQPAPSAPAAAPSLFDEVGLKATVPGAPVCPGCAAPLPPNAVLCVKCGYNLKLGRRMETMTTSGVAAAGHGGHGESAEEALARAAAALEEDKQAERSKTGEGLPWWAYLIAIVMVVGFMVCMMLIPKEYAMRGAGVVLIIAGIGISIFAYFRVVYIAFTENIGFGLMTLLLGGCGWLVYCIMRWDRCGGYFWMNFAGNGVQWIGYGFIWAADMFAAEPGEEASRYRLPSRPPSAMVCAADRESVLPLLRPSIGGASSEIEATVSL